MRNVFVEGSPDKYDAAKVLIDAIIDEQQRMTASYKKLLSLEIGPTLVNS